MSKVYHNSFYAMGTRFNAVIPDIDFELGDKIFFNIQKEVDRIESFLSYFSRNSEVYKLNNRITNNHIHISEELFNILEVCLKYNKLTEGAFDITLRPIIEQLVDNNNKVIDDEAKNQSNSFGIEKIKLSEDDKTITFFDEHLKIDFGGFGKGYALDKVKNLLLDYNVQNAFISFGESSILALGCQPNGNCWKVGINNYLSPGSSITTIRLNNESVSSSANFTISDNGLPKRKINVINPRTKAPAESNKSITVKSSSAIESEILSTAFLIMKKEKIYNILNEFKGISAVEVIYNDEPEINFYKGEYQY